jgi:hydroxymethylbilane synthase
MNKKLTFATRPSALARWQTQFVISQLKSQWPDLTCMEVVITTQGDRILDQPLPQIGGKGIFTYELEQALLAEKVDAAVHSLKDLPTEDASGLSVAVIPLRADVRDVWICPEGLGIDQVPAGSIVGTSSTRRAAQLKAYRPDLSVEPIRGNVGTRINKATEGQYDAIILAAAGIIRLGLEKHITEYLPYEIMLPAPGQGALGIQCRADDDSTLRTLEVIDHSPTHLAVTAERTFLAALGGGCSLPVGALASTNGEQIKLEGLVAAEDGSRVLRISAKGKDPQRLGKTLAQQALAEGAADLLSNSKVTT